MTEEEMKLHVEWLLKVIENTKSALLDYQYEDPNTYIILKELLNSYLYDLANSRKCLKIEPIHYYNFKDE